jgi:Mg2+ and Co2+ transporter CorA
VLTQFVVARTESLRDLVSTIVEASLTIRGNRQNAIMQKVTSWAAIIALPTAVPGCYGMNVPYPGVRPALRRHHLDHAADGAVWRPGHLLFKRLDWL